jgi:hypothetical protein
MSCCGQKRSALKQSPPTAPGAGIRPAAGEQSAPAPAAPAGLSSAGLRAHFARNAARRMR